MEPAPNAYPGPGGIPPPSPPARSTDGFAIASFVLGLLGILCGSPILSVIFGVIALRRIRLSGAGGRGLAIAGIVLSSLWVLFFVVVVTWAILNASQRSSDGTITRAGSISLTNLQVGDCVTHLPTGTLLSVHVSPCSDAHAAEVYHRYIMPNGSYPGDDEVERQVSETCEQALPGYVSAAPETVDYEIYFLHPLETSWSEDRTAHCLAADPSGASLFGSIRDRGPTP